MNQKIDAKQIHINTFQSFKIKEILGYGKMRVSLVEMCSCTPAGLATADIQGIRVPCRGP